MTFESIFDVEFLKLFGDNANKIKNSASCPQMSNDANNYYFRLEMPGFKKEEIEIIIIGRELKIKAESNSNNTLSGPLLRSASWEINFPAMASTYDVWATLENGILLIRMGKMIPPSAEEPIKVQIK